jgi:hypothetical protein
VKEERHVVGQRRVLHLLPSRRRRRRDLEALGACRHLQRGRGAAQRGLDGQGEAGGAARGLGGGVALRAHHQQQGAGVLHIELELLLQAAAAAGLAKDW